MSETRSVWELNRIGSEIKYMQFCGPGRQKTFLMPLGYIMMNMRQ